MRIKVIDKKHSSFGLIGQVKGKTRIVNKDEGYISEWLYLANFGIGEFYMAESQVRVL